MLRTLGLVAGLCLALASACAPAEEPPGTGSTPADTAAAAPPPTPGASPDEAALTELSERFVRGIRAADPDTVAMVYSAQAEVFTPGTEQLLLGQDAIREHFAARLKELQVDEFEIQRSAFVVRPDVAYSFGVWRAVTRPGAGGPPVASSGHLTDVYRREGNGPWVVAHEHVSVVTPLPAPADSFAIPF